MSFGVRAASAALALILALSVPVTALAQSVADIQKQIDDHNAQIVGLNNEIAQYQAQLNATSQKKKTLQNTLN